MEEYHQITINEYLSWKQEIIQRLNSSIDNFIVIGYRLKQIRDTEAYRNEGYDSLGQFVQAEFNIGISTASKFMKINDVYSVNGNSMELKEEYRNFGYNKLYEMIALPIEDRQMVTPDTPVKDIREIKKFNDEKNAEPEKKDNTDQDGLMEGLIRIVFGDEKMEKAFNKIIHGEYRSNSDQCEILAALIPAGSRVVRYKTLMVFFSGDGIRLKRIGKDDEMITFSDFYEIVEYLFQKEWSETFLEKEASFDGEKEESGQAEKEDSVVNAQKELETTEGVSETDENVIEKPKSVSEEPKNVSKQPESVSKPAESAQKPSEDTEVVALTNEELDEIIESMGNKESETKKEFYMSELGELEAKEECEEITMTRYEYMQSLTEFGMGTYLYKHMPRTILGSQKGAKAMREWIHETVDEKGRTYRS